MQALVLQDFWKLAVEERPDPIPGAGEVLIRITATGICGSDIHGYTGENGRRKPGQVMGHETVGRVVACGNGVTTHGVGDVVTVNPVIWCGKCAACRSGREQTCPNKRQIGVHAHVQSAFAELMVAPALQAVILPSSMPEEYGALAEPLAVGLHAVRRGACTPDDSVLVVGGGPIGQACLLAAKRQGVTRIVVTEPDMRRHALLEKLGVAVVDPSEGDTLTLVADALGGPATLVLDAVGSTASLADSLACSQPCARVVLVGMAMPEVKLPAFAVSVAERNLIGSFCYTAAEFIEAAEWVGAAPSDLAHLIEDRVALNGAAAAFEALAKQETGASKVLVYPNGLPA
jgi:threonine dehydrogenase-like Zn-dependent dehydrogenase